MSTPAFDDLPRHQGVPTAWHHPRDLAPADRVVSAARLIRTGEVFSLDVDPTLIDPPLFDRRAARHRRLTFDDGLVLDDVLDDYFPQAASHWDGLGHVALAPGVFHGDSTGGQWRGIAGRAVLLDLESVRGADPATARPITVEELARCRGNTGTHGDILLLHTGFLRWYRQQPAHRRATLTEWVGLEHTEAMARYLWDSGVVAIAADNPTLEVWPPDKSAAAWPWGYLHRVLLAGLGIPIGELWWLADLADHCRENHRHDVFLTSAPWRQPATVGSPANAVAIT